MSALVYTCESLLANKDSPPHFDTILTQFINSQSLDHITTAQYVIDPSFPSLIQCILFPIQRYQLPGSLEGKPPQIVLDCLHFLTHISIINPDCLHIVAANVPFDLIIPIFFGRFDQNSDLQNGAGSLLIPILKFLAIISTSPEIRIEDSDSITLMFQTLQQFYSINEVSHWAVSTTVGFIKNSPTFSAIIKKTVDYLSIRNEIGQQLTSDDPSTVLSSLALLVVLFPTQVSAETSVKVALCSLTGAGTFVTPYLAAVIITELAEQANLTSDDFVVMFRAALNGGPKTHTIYNLMIDLAMYHKEIVNAIYQSNCFYTLINSMLDANDGYVTIAGSHFLSFVFQDVSEMVLDKDITETFEKAIKITLTPPKFASLDKREASISLMRIMLSIPDSVTYVVKLLQENEEELCVDFQRQAELNNSYISLQYFLLLWEGSSILTHWRSKLAQIVTDTPFPALLVHVLSESRNRTAIGDALRAQHIIASSLQSDTCNPLSPFYDAIVSGMLVTNTRRHDEKQKDISRMTEAVNRFHQKIVQLEREKEENEIELTQVLSESDDQKYQLESQLQTKLAYATENKQLAESLRKLKRKHRQLSEKKKVYDTENVDMQAKVEVFQKATETADEINTSFKSKMSEYSSTEIKLKKILQKKADVSNSLKLILREVDKEKKATSAVRAKANKTENKLSTIRKQQEAMQATIDRLTDENNQLEEAQKETARTVINHRELQSRSSRSGDGNESLAKLKEELDKVIFERELTERKSLNRLGDFNTIQARINTLEEENKNFKLLFMLIHKTTSGPDMLPKGAEAFLPSVNNEDFDSN